MADLSLQAAGVFQTPANWPAPKGAGGRLGGALRAPSARCAEPPLRRLRRIVLRTTRARRATFSRDFATRSRSPKARRGRLGAKLRGGAQRPTSQPQPVPVRGRLFGGWCLKNTSRLTPGLPLRRSTPGSPRSGLPVPSLGSLPADDEHRPSSPGFGVNARETLGLGEAFEVALVRLHVRAETLPDGARLLVGQGYAVDRYAKPRGPTFSGARPPAHCKSLWISRACTVTSTLR
jgi:hypothetical protein